jgi:ketosteroid isomerase-like protein
MMSKRRHSSYRLFLIALIMVSSLLAFPFDSPSENSVQELLESWVAMWNSYDLKKVEGLFLLDPRVSYFSSEKEGLIQGIEAVREHHVGFGFVDGGKVQENKLWVEEVRINHFGEAAVVAGIWYFQRATDDVESAQKGPFTFVCVKQGKGWRLAHLNFSEYK